MFGQTLKLCKHHLTSNTKPHKEFTKGLDFKCIKFPVNVRDTHQIEKKNSVGIAVSALTIDKNIQSKYQKNFAEKNMLISYCKGKD